MKRRAKKTMAIKPVSALRRHEWAVISGDNVMMNLTHEEAMRLVDEKDACGEHRATVATNTAAGRLLLSRNQ